MTKGNSPVRVVLLGCLLSLVADGLVLARTADTDSPQAAPVSLLTPHLNDDEPEEPDFAFITGGPYTQKKHSIQFIFPTQFGRRRSNLGGSTLEHAEFGTLLRTEWGLTDRLELDAIVPAEGMWDRLGDATLDSNFALADAVVGVRYRLLREPSAPFTLTMGPQVVFPSGSSARGTGFGKVGCAWDLAAAKDWRGAVFLYTSLNYAFFPSVRDPGSTSPQAFHLHHIFGGTALGLRPLEKNHGSSHHDLHLFFEFGVGLEQGLDRSLPLTRKISDLHAMVSPGIRYGLLTHRKDLYEVGLSFPLGLDRGTPRYGVILQLQFEHLFGFRSE